VKPDQYEVRERLRRDRERLLEHYATHMVNTPRVLWLHPSYQCILLYRLSAYQFRRGRRLLARFLWHLNLWLTGAEFGLISDAGAGLVVIHPMSTYVFGHLGRDCTLWGHGGIGGGRGLEDIGAGPGLPVVGDRVVFAPRVMVLGPVRIGDDCEIGPGCIVLRELAPGTRVEVPDHLQRTRRDTHSAQD
jgi:serine O-acetyltransferase